MAATVTKREAALDLDALIRTIVDERKLIDEKDVLPLVEEAIPEDVRIVVLRELLLVKISNVMNNQFHLTAREPVGPALRVVTSEGVAASKASKSPKAYRISLLERGVRVPGEARRRQLGKCSQRHIKLICVDRRTRARVALGDLQRWEKLYGLMVKEKTALVGMFDENIVNEILGASIEMLDID